MDNTNKKRVQRTRTSVTIPVGERIMRVGISSDDEMTPTQFLTDVAYYGIKVPYNFVLLLLAEAPKLRKDVRGIIFNEFLLERNDKHYLIKEAV